MDSFFIALLVVGLAELGDKTQLVTLYLSARFRRPLAILAGVFCASLLNLGLAVALGAWLGHLLGDWLEWLVALLFIGMGTWLLFAGKENDEEVPPKAAGRNAFLTTFSLFFLMEMGDKTQLATLGLAAGLDRPALVLSGAVLAMVLVNSPAIWLGHRYASRLPRLLLNRISAGVFVLVGLVLMVRLLA
ncbi:MAG: TMEM165/GDT1 family protein [Wenzhouxiangella sp.]|nr:TMEM165/GDT1 family protein [Wenzhouxiangella sp.]TVR94296.1 MAG: TMEM165/GDT1 family protein [Wenzhouxiangellaceae bacterium]